jgi:hypothetical protein
MQLKLSTLKRRWLARLLLLTVILTAGCAEGPLWRAGKYSPWARNHWAAEEQIADTLFERKRRMNESVAAVENAPVEDQQKVADGLVEILHRDPVLLLRLHSVQLLGKLNCPAAVEALVDASHDHNSDIRIASIKSWASLPPETAIPNLQEMIGSDTNVDVRLAATRALGGFSGQRAVAAISLALDDRNPALQLRAAESLQAVTGEQFGRDILAWKKYIQNIAPTQDRISPSTEDSSSGQFKMDEQRVADQSTDSIFR